MDLTLNILQDGTLKVISITRRSGPGSNGNEGVLTTYHVPKTRASAPNAVK